MNLKQKKTDHYEQSLVLFPRVKFLVREGMDAICNDVRLPVELLSDALELKRFIEALANEDKPKLFQKIKSICKCEACNGAGVYKHVPEDSKLEVEWPKCEVCDGEGQLYVEITKRGIPATEYYRKKMAK